MNNRTVFLCFLFLIISNVAFPQDFSVAREYCSPKQNLTLQTVFKELREQGITYAQMNYAQKAQGGNFTNALLDIWPETETVYIKESDDSSSAEFIFEKNDCWMKNASTGDLFARVSRKNIHYPDGYLSFLTPSGIMATDIAHLFFSGKIHENSLEKAIIMDKANEIKSFLIKESPQEDEFSLSLDNVNIRIKKKQKLITSMMLEKGIDFVEISNTFSKDKSQKFSLEQRGILRPAFDSWEPVFGFKIEKAEESFILTSMEPWSKNFYAGLKDVDIFTTPVAAVNDYKVTDENIPSIETVMNDPKTLTVSLLFKNGKKRVFRKLTGEEQDLLFRMPIIDMSPFWISE